jgi:hypothetical protein
MITRLHDLSVAVTQTILCLGLAMAVGCASGPLFNANFDADAVGSLPNTDPPGQPAGDEIYFVDANQASMQVTVVNSAALGSKSLQYSNANVPVYSRYIGFISKSEALGANQKFRAAWDGRVDLDSNGSALNILLGDPHFIPFAEMRFKDGQVLLRTTLADTYEPIGPYDESQNHAVFITIDKSTQKYSIVMVPGSVTSGWRTVLVPEALDTNRPSLYFYYSENKSSSGKYVVDKVAIRKVD